MYCYIALPLDLHVLSLPLAFILSQDQTLLCIFLISLSLTPTIRFSKETDALVHFVSVLASLYFPSVFSMIFSVLGAFRPAFPVPRFFGVAKVETYFLFSKSFLKIFSVPCPAPSGNPFRDTPSFQTGLQRYSFFPSFQTFMQLFLPSGRANCARIPPCIILNYTGCGSYGIEKNWQDLLPYLGIDFRNLEESFRHKEGVCRMIVLA